MFARFLIHGIACLALTSLALADEMALPDGHGYMLIRVLVNPRERVAMLSMMNVDTEVAVAMNLDSFKPAGSNAWMALVAIPPGRYFWSMYEPSYGLGSSEARSLRANFRRSASGSADDTFEIAANAVNYVGDWRMRIESTGRRRPQPDIEYDASTLQRFVAEYPGLAGKYEIYLSAMGKAAMSLQELAKILEAEEE